jgi:Flp pilus assembly protein TadG
MITLRTASRLLCKIRVASGHLGSRFAASRSGNVAIMTALSITMLLGVSGGAVDFARAYSARMTTQNVMDGDRRCSELLQQHEI